MLEGTGDGKLHTLKLFFLLVVHVLGLLEHEPNQTLTCDLVLSAKKKKISMLTNFHIKSIIVLGNNCLDIKVNTLKMKETQCTTYFLSVYRYQFG